MASLTSSLIVRLIDQVTGPAKGVEESLRRINRAGMQGGGAAPSFADRMDEQQARVGAAIAANNRALDTARGRIVDAVAGYYVLNRTVGRAVTTAANFQEAMINVGVVSRASSEQVAAMEQQAKELGRTTMFTASQVADGMGYLAMAGFSVDQVMGGMEQTLNLAAAGQMELGRSADIVSNILTGYGLQVEDLNSVADILVGTFTRANTNLDQLGTAFTYAGPIAAAAGMEFAETAAVLGRLGDAGYQGSMGGTALRGAIVRLMAPTKGAAEAMAALDVSASDVVEAGEDIDAAFADAAEAMERIGLTVTDAAGRMLPFADIMQQLEGHADDVGLMAELFGQRAGPAMAALLRQGADSVRDLTEELADLDGEAKRVADARMAGFNGQMRAFRSAVEGSQIAIGSALLPALTDLVRGFTRLIGPVTEFIEANPRFVSAVVGTASALVGLKVALAGISFVALLGKGGALALLAGGLQLVRVVGTPVAGFFETLAMRSTLASRALGRMPTRLERISDAMRLLVRRIPGMGLALKVLGGLGAALAGLTAPVWMGVAAGALALGGAGLLLHRNWEKVSAFFSGFLEVLREELGPALEWAGDQWTAFTEALGIDGIVASIGEGFTQAKEMIGDFFGYLRGMFRRQPISDEERAAWEESGGNAARQMVDTMKAIFDDFGRWITGQWAVDWVSGLVGIDLREAGASAVNSLKQEFLNFLGWIASFPRMVIDTIGNIDLSGIIRWPQPPAWWRQIMASDHGGGSRGGRGASGHRASGGPVWRGGAFLVGEREPEIFSPATGGHITPLSAVAEQAESIMRSLAGSTGGQNAQAAAGPVSVRIGDIHVSGASDPVATARAVRNMLERELAAALRGVHADMGVRA